MAPVLVLFWVTLAGGALITFAPQMVDDALLVAAGLFVMGMVAAVARWRMGVLVDRFGARRFVAPLVVLSASGVALVAWAIGGPGAGSSAGRALAFLAGALLLGLGYGALQNLTLVVALAAVGRRHQHQASAVWNVGFDLGSGVGSVAVAVGALAGVALFSSAMWAAAAAALAVLVLPLAATVRETRPG